jgi:hypothetical protein
VLLAAFALVAGLLVYLYLPWRAGADPVINWGDPDNWDGFKWMVTGRGYRRFFFALPGAELPARLEDWWNLTGDQFQFPFLAWPLAALGLWELARRDRWLALGSFLHAAVSLVYSIGYDVSDAFVHLLPVYFYAALWMGQGAASLIDVAGRLRWSGWDPMLIVRLVTAGLLLLPVISLVEEWEGMDVVHDGRAEEFSVESVEVVEPGALILWSTRQ